MVQGASKSRYGPLADIAVRGSEARFRGAGSTGRRNTGVKSLCWGFKLQGLAWSFVELTRDFVWIGLRVHRQVGAADLPLRLAERLPPMRNSDEGSVTEKTARAAHKLAGRATRPFAPCTWGRRLFSSDHG